MGLSILDVVARVTSMRCRHVALFEVGANSRGNRQGRGPEAGVYLASVRNGHEDSVAGGEHAGREQERRLGGGMG